MILMIYFTMKLRLIWSATYRWTSGDACLQMDSLNVVSYYCCASKNLYSHRAKQRCNDDIKWSENAKTDISPGFPLLWHNWITTWRFLCIFKLKELQKQRHCLWKILVSSFIVKHPLSVRTQTKTNKKKTFCCCLSITSVRPETSCHNKPRRSIA